MKKVLSISLLACYLATATGWIEVAKLPVLLQHYKIHKIWDSEITFCEFIFAHYLEDISDNPDRDLDKKLPFKSHPADSARIILVVEMPPVSTIFSKPVEGFDTTDSKQSTDYQETSLNSDYLSKIWQPPKMING